MKVRGLELKIKDKHARKGGVRRERHRKARGRDQNPVGVGNQAPGHMEDRKKGRVWRELNLRGRKGRMRDQDPLGVGNRGPRGHNGIPIPWLARIPSSFGKYSYPVNCLIYV